MVTPIVTKNGANLKLRFKTNFATEFSKKIDKVAVGNTHAMNVS